MSLTRRVADFRDHALLVRGSTRSVSLMRILLVFVVWSRWAYVMRPQFNLEPWRLLVSSAFWIATPMMLIGWWSRASTAVTGAVLLVVFFGFGMLDGQTNLVEHHTWLLTMGVCLLALTPCGGSWSVDRWLSLNRAERAGHVPPPEQGDLWALHLIRLQLSAVYFWSAVDKTEVPFLRGDRLEQLTLFLYTGAEYPDLPGFRLLVVTSAWTVVLLEYALAFALWFPRSRGLALAAAFGLHGVFYWAIPVNTFTATMWALLIAFLEPEAVHRGIDRLHGVDTVRRGG